jgi:iron complex outermembrane recepter protein
MSGWKSSRICVWAIASIALSLLGILPSRAAEVKTESRLQDLQRPATTVKDWLAQTSTPIEITGVRRL